MKDKVINNRRKTADIEKLETAQAGFANGISLQLKDLIDKGQHRSLNDKEKKKIMTNKIMNNADGTKRLEPLFYNSFKSPNSQITDLSCDPKVCILPHSWFDPSLQDTLGSETLIGRGFEAIGDTFEKFWRRTANSILSISDNVEDIDDLGTNELGKKIKEKEQNEIIILIAEGLTNGQIAEHLFLSNHTINTHRKNIMAKLDIPNTAGIVMFAVKKIVFGGSSLFKNLLIAFLYSSNVISFSIYYITYLVEKCYTISL